MPNKQSQNKDNSKGSYQVNIARNTGIPLDLGFIQSLNINRSAVERRASTIGKRRTVKKQHQAAWLLKAITFIDLTTLSGDDTPGKVRRLCQKAKHPVRADIIAALGVEQLNITTGAVCVYHNMIATAVVALKGTDIPVAAVSTGFPAGQSPLPIKLAEIKASVEEGAQEIDIVISREKVLTGDWQGIYDEVKAFRLACKNAHIKTILATGELATLTNVAKASWVCMMAGADFIKTSTGKEPVNATLAVSLVMVRAIRDYFELTGFYIGYKPAGGIQTAKQAIEYMILMKEELGNAWLDPALFRFGASSLLGDIERQLEHFVTGSYSASYRHAMS